MAVLGSLILVVPFLFGLVDLKSGVMFVLNSSGFKHWNVIPRWRGFNQCEVIPEEWELLRPLDETTITRSEYSMEFNVSFSIMGF